MLTTIASFLITLKRVLYPTVRESLTGKGLGAVDWLAGSGIVRAEYGLLTFE